MSASGRLTWLIAVGALYAGTLQAEPDLLRLSHSHQAQMSSEIHSAAVRFRDYVNERTEGIEVRIYPNNSLGQEREVYEAMQFGAGADCAISGTAILSNFYRRAGVLDLPFLWRDLDHLHATLDGPVGDDLAAELQQVNFRVLAWLDSWGARNVVTTREPVRRAEDLAGLKIRTIPTPVYIATVNALGASATPMAFGEIYTALETGVLDGFEHTPTVVLAGRFYEVAHHLTLTRHLYGPLAMVCSAQRWAELHESDRRLVAEAATLTSRWQRGQTAEREREALDRLAGEGVDIHTIDVGQFRSQAQSLRLQLAAKMKAVDLLKDIEAAAKAAPGKPVRSGP
jgi:tripartite ATP-independent transporter DctP family solute receptor